MDIRKMTYLIIEKEGRYLQCVDFTHTVLWCDSPWSAWRTRSREEADRVGDLLGGEPVLFNPVVGRTARLKR